MIALEKARRHSEVGENVLFLCFNRFLRDYCKANYPRDNVVYNTIDGFACSFCGTETADFLLLQDKLESAYYEGHFPFKHIIIDEGQDFGQDRIEEADIITTLETIVLSEEVNGSFYLFYDRNQLVQGKKIPRYISDSDCKLTLYRNCRNTENIAITSMRPLGSTSKPKMFAGCVRGESPKVYIAENVDKHKVFLDSILKRLIEKKINDVVILTCKTEESSVFSQYCTDGKYPFDGLKFRFTTCRKFKGLEADNIILVDVNAGTFNAKEVLRFYVGASRAKVGLNIISTLDDDACIALLRSHFDYPADKPVKNPSGKLAEMMNAQRMR